MQVKHKSNANFIGWSSDSWMMYDGVSKSNWNSDILNIQTIQKVSSLVLKGKWQIIYELKNYSGIS